MSIRRSRSHLRGSVHSALTVLLSESRLLEQVPALPATQTCVRGAVCGTRVSSVR